jgi:hypothetical protein
MTGQEETLKEKCELFSFGLGYLPGKMPGLAHGEVQSQPPASLLQGIFLGIIILQA